MTDDGWGIPLADEATFDAFLDAYYRRTLRFVRGQQPYWDDATVRDVVQEAWAAVFNRVGRIEHARAYLFRVLASKIADEINHRAPLISTDEVPDRALPSAEDIALLPETLREKSEEILEVLRRVYELPEAQRTAYRLKVTQGISNPDIAAILGCKPASVDVYVHRARERLRKQFGAPRVAEFEAATGRHV